MLLIICEGMEARSRERSLCQVVMTASRQTNWKQMVWWLHAHWYRWMPMSLDPNFRFKIGWKDLMKRSLPDLSTGCCILVRFLKDSFFEGHVRLCLGYSWRRCITQLFDQPCRDWVKVTILAGYLQNEVGASSTATVWKISQNEVSWVLTTGASELTVERLLCWR